MATLTYRHFGNPTQDCLCAHYRKKVRLSSISAVELTGSNTINYSARKCHLIAARCGGFFDFIYIMLDVIGTCMQIFKNIDLKKKRLFSVKAVVHCFWLRLYRYIKIMTGAVSPIFLRTKSL